MRTANRMCFARIVRVHYAFASVQLVAGAGYVALATFRGMLRRMEQHTSIKYAVWIHNGFRGRTMVSFIFLFKFCRSFVPGISCAPVAAVAQPDWCKILPFTHSPSLPVPLIMPDALQQYAAKRSNETFKYSVCPNAPHQMPRVIENNNFAITVFYFAHKARWPDQFMGERCGCRCCSLLSNCRMAKWPNRKRYSFRVRE